jgi:hypothetical protein
MFCVWWVLNLKMLNIWTSVLYGHIIALATRRGHFTLQTRVLYGASTCEIFYGNVALHQAFLLVLYFGYLLSGSFHQCFTLIFILIVKYAWWAVCFS